MANLKVTELTDISTSLTDDDLVMVVNDPAGTPASRKATLTRVKQQTGGLLGYNAYSQAGNYTTSSVTFADVDATNMKATAAAPPSGKVLLRLTGPCGGTATGVMLWNLRDGGGNITGTRCFVGGSPAGNASYSVVIILTGLTPGTSYTWKWGFASSTAGQTVTMFGTTAAGADGAWIMEVWSIPQ